MSWPIATIIYVFIAGFFTMMCYGLWRVSVVKLKEADNNNLLEFARTKQYTFPDMDDGMMPDREVCVMCGTTAELDSGDCAFCAGHEQAEAEAAGQLPKQVSTDRDLLRAAMADGYDSDKSTADLIAKGLLRQTHFVNRDVVLLTDKARDLIRAAINDSSCNREET